jgi:hypothetical protein
VLYAQNFFVDWEFVDERFDEHFDERFDERFDKRLDERLDEIVDDKCDDEVIIHMLSQLKKEHVVDALFCYDVLILNREQIRFVRHETANFV